MRDLYQKVRDAMPKPVQSAMSRMVYALTSKPYVRKDNLDLQQKFPGTFTGGMVISADFELAWAWRFAKQTNDPFRQGIEKARQARENFPVLIKLCETFGIPVTWATVGALFLKQTNKETFEPMTRIPHFENVNWRFDQGDWYDGIPRTSWEKAKEWYAPDLIESLLSSGVNHEIGCHTFSHIDFTDNHCPAQVAEDEIRACIEAAKPYGIKLESFVFPGGTLGNFSILKKHGIQIYRKSMGYDLGYPFIDETGLIVTDRGECLEGREDHGWSDQYILKRFKKNIDKAIKTGTIVHFWFHPSMNPHPLQRLLPELFKYAAEKREKGQLWLGTMKQILDLRTLKTHNEN